jgi:hypothetical protein
MKEPEKTQQVFRQLFDFLKKLKSTVIYIIIRYLIFDSHSYILKLGILFFLITMDVNFNTQTDTQ